MTIPPIIHLIFIFAVPLYLHHTKKDSLLISWIILSIFIDIFNSVSYLNITAIKATSIILLPYFLKNIKHLYRTNAGKLILVYFIYLGTMSLLHGYIFPWPDTTGTRTLRDISQGRTILHLGSMVLEFITVFYLATKFRFECHRKTMMKAMFIASIVAIIGIFLEQIFQFDFYRLFTSDTHGLAYGYGRAHGFNFEPRGAGQAMVYAIIVLLTMNSIKLPFRWSLIIAASIGLYMSTSTAAIILLLAAFCLLLLIHLLYLKDRVRSFMISALPIFAIFAIALSTIAVLHKDHRVTAWKDNLANRSHLLFSENFASRFEVFDATAINFFAHKPGHLIFGTGPGMISIAATPFLIEREKESWNYRIDPLPHMGIVLLIANSGIIGLIPLIWALFLISRKFIREYKKNKAMLYTPLLISILFCTLYLVQIRYFHLVGLALAISFTTPRLEKNRS